MITVQGVDFILSVFFDVSHLDCYRRRPIASIVFTLDSVVKIVFTWKSLEYQLIENHDDPAIAVMPEVDR